MKKILALALSAVMAIGLFAGCSQKKDEPSVYFLNFKPEQDAQYQAIAKAYTAKTGIPVKVVTAAAGTYEQQLRSEIAKNDAPTLFQVNGPVGFAAWRDYTANIAGSEFYSHLADKSLAIRDGEAVYAVPFAIEGYGIIVNKVLMEKYFATEGAKAKSLEEINNFAALKAVAEDMQAKKDELGIKGVFAATSLQPGEDWRWQTHLSNVPLYYEWHNNNVDLTKADSTKTITFEYAEEFRQIFDLYLQNSTVDPKTTGTKTVNDSMAEFAMGQAAMVQNGNWAYGQISDVSGNTVKPEDVAYLPIYIGVAGEETQGLCIGTENFICVNKKASEADQKASLDFLNWLYTSDEGKAFVTNDLGFIAPFDSFTEADKPADPLGRLVMEWSSRSDITNVPWNFTIYPSQTFKDNFGGDLLKYAQGNMEWNAVKENVVNSWATEKAAVNAAK